MSIERVPTGRDEAGNITYEDVTVDDSRSALATRQCEECEEAERRLQRAKVLLENAAEYMAQTRQWKLLRKTLEAMDTIGQLVRPPPVPLPEVNPKYQDTM